MSSHIVDVTTPFNPSTTTMRRARPRVNARTREYDYFDDDDDASGKRKSARRGFASYEWFVKMLAILFVIIFVFVFGSSRSTSERTDDASQTTASEAFCGRTDPLVCAHGGDVRGVDELANSATTLTRSIREGQTCVEIDVARTSDGALVSMHGRDVVRFTKGAIEDAGEVALAELQMWNSEGENEALDFERALKLVVGRGLRQITVDFKENPPLGRHGLAEHVLEVATKLSCDECLFWGKNDDTIRDAIRLGARRVGYVVGNFSNDMLAKGYDKVIAGRVKGAHAIAVQSEMANAALIRTARRHKLAVHVWTVNDKTKMRRIVNLGVDGIVTDQPKLLQSVIQEFRAQCKDRGL